MKKVILAYSGGLDTSCCIQWLRDKGFEVVCFSANLGSEFSPADLRKRALKTGAKKIYIQDLRQEFASQYILPALKANACYEDKYLLATALGRPLIAKHLVDIARREKAAFVAHGCTAKGNDQVRLDLTVHMLNHRLKIIAPLREWELTSRDSEIKYARQHGIPIQTTREKPYSIDTNIWGTSVEAGILEDIGQDVPENSYVTLKPLRKVADREILVTVEFKRGTPVRLNNKIMDFVNLIEKLNKLGAQCGVGRTDVIEDRVVGIKSREIYEAPAAWILHTAHKELESLTLDRETLSAKRMVALYYAQLVYQGLWFSSVKKSLDAFVEETQKRASGSITLRLYKGTMTVVRRKSNLSLYNKALATYGKDDTFSRNLAKGFIELFSLPYRQ